MADEHTTVKLPQLPSYPSDEVIKSDDMLYVWNSQSGQLQHAKVEQLPFSFGGGGGPVTHLASPFMLKIGNEQISVVGNDTVISDTRLLGKTNYPVSSTQLNNSSFREDEVVYDDENGTVTILNFQLQSGEWIIIFPAGVPDNSSGGSLQPILDRLAELEAIVAPLRPTVSGANYARMWWTGPLPLPAGWEEDTDWRDYTPIHAPNNSVIGQPVTGSSNTRTLGANNLPDFTLTFAGKALVVGTNLTPGGGGDSNRRCIQANGADLLWSIGYTGGKQAFSIVQKSKYGMWIKYVGV